MTAPFTFEEASHTYRLGDLVIPGITSVLKESNLMTEWSYGDEFLKRGRLVHLFCQYHNEGELAWETVPDHLMGFVLAWERAKKATGFMPLTWEVPKYHPLFRFAGTYDNDGMFPDGSRAIVEIKTGLCQPATAFQTAAQEILVGERRKRLAFELHADGTFKIESFQNHMDANMFLSVLSIYQWRVKNGLISKKGISAPVQ